MSIITKAGAYEHIDAEDYHRNPDLLPAPSLSSSGAKTIFKKSPFHYWFDSPMNPNRPAEKSKPHLNVGKAAHDLMLLSERWPEYYHVLPEGFSEAATVKFKEAIAAKLEAEEAGKVILRYQDYETVKNVSAAIGLNAGAKLALSAGLPEVTLAWQDNETGVWLKARPDWLPFTVINGADIMVVSDLKFMDPRSCSPDGFSRAVAEYGYHNSAAFYEDGIEAIYGRKPTHWLFLPIEKEPPYSVSLYALHPADVERGRIENRHAINRFAECLAKGTEQEFWPGYTPEIETIGLPAWRRKQIDEFGSVNEAALVNAGE